MPFREANIHIVQWMSTAVWMPTLCGHKADAFQNASQKGAGHISLIQFCFQLALESVPEIKSKVIPDLKDDSVLCGTEIFLEGF